MHLTNEETMTGVNMIRSKGFSGSKRTVAERLSPSAVERLLPEGASDTLHQDGAKRVQEWNNAFIEGRMRLDNGSERVFVPCMDEFRQPHAGAIGRTVADRLLRQGHEPIELHGGSSSRGSHQSDSTLSAAVPSQDEGVHWSQVEESSGDARVFVQRSASMELPKDHHMFPGESLGGMAHPMMQIKLPPLDALIRESRQPGPQQMKPGGGLASADRIQSVGNPRSAGSLRSVGAVATAENHFGFATSPRGFEARTKSFDLSYYRDPCSHCGRFHEDMNEYFGEACQVRVVPLPTSNHRVHKLQSRAQEDESSIQHDEKMKVAHMREYGMSVGQQSCRSSTSKRSSIDLLLGSGVHARQDTGRHSLESWRSFISSSPEQHSKLLEEFQQRPDDDAFIGSKVLSPGSPLKSFEKTGFTVVAEPKKAKKYQTGPSIGAHASQIVDHQFPRHDSSPETQKLKPIMGEMKSCMDADLHDTFGAHAWQECTDGKSLFANGHQVKTEQGKSLEKQMPHRNIPSYAYLRKVKQAMMSDNYADGSKGGYIAEAKRVLNEAMTTVRSSPYSGSVTTSHSGAIGPLLNYLKNVSGDDEKCSSTLDTVSLMESNLPNRVIISDLQGRKILTNVLRDCRTVPVKEKTVQLLWDLDCHGGKDAASIMSCKDFEALVFVLEETSNSEIASHCLHLLQSGIDAPPEARPFMDSETSKSMAIKVANETCAHKHHLQDAAQYCLGELLGALLSEVDDITAQQCLQQLLDSLICSANPSNCQIILTVLSSVAGRKKPRNLLISMSAAKAVMAFVHQSRDERLQARAFSLLKVLSAKADAGVKSNARASWYFGEDDFLE